MIDYNQESQQLNNSSSVSKIKISSGKDQDQKIKEQQLDNNVKDNDSSLDRDEISYSQDFVSESIHSASLSQSDKKNEIKSANALQNKVANIEGSGENIDD